MKGSFLVKDLFVNSIHKKDKRASVRNQKTCVQGAFLSYLKGGQSRA